jgi:hypothetical protein
MDVTPHRLSYLVVLASTLAATGCKRKQPPPAPPMPSVSAASSTRAAPDREPREGEIVHIPSGTFQAGSVPGEAGREPDLEPRLHALELGPFEIERLPYPNHPAEPPLTNVSRERARQLCAERGSRLCTELEWERACKGPDSDPYPSGATWNARCVEAPLRCASGYDVLGMGTTLREWTASNRDAERDSAVVRGAGTTAAAGLHRCATRRTLAAETEAADLGFRCCKGAPNAARVKEPALGPTFEKTKLAPERLIELLGSDAATREIAKDVKYFREPEAAKTVVARGPGDTKGFSFSVAPLLWHPVAGAEYLLVSARSGDHTSFIVAYYALGDGEYRLASSFVMKNEPGPVALAYSNDIRPRLHFSTCWGCVGETGKILHRRPDHVVILQP